MIAICVDFEIDPTKFDAFLSIIQKNASESVANEVGCYQFDILQDLQNPTKIFLYELYDDAAAFNLHKQSSHYLEFNKASSEMVMSKSVRLLQKINH